MIELSSFWLLRASWCSFVMLGVGGCACSRMLLTALLTASACSVSSGRTADSSLAVISVTETLPGVREKFRPFFSKYTSASLRVLDDKLITQFVLSKEISVKEKAAFVALLTVFGGIKHSPKELMLCSVLMTWLLFSCLLCVSESV